MQESLRFGGLAGLAGGVTAGVVYFSGVGPGVVEVDWSLAFLSLVLGVIVAVLLSLFLMKAQLEGGRDVLKEEWLARRQQRRDELMEQESLPPRASRKASRKKK